MSTSLENPRQRPTTSNEELALRIAKCVVSILEKRIVAGNDVYAERLLIQAYREATMPEVSV